MPGESVERRYFAKLIVAFRTVLAGPGFTVVLLPETEPIVLLAIIEIGLQVAGRVCIFSEPGVAVGLVVIIFAVGCRRFKV